MTARVRTGEDLQVVAFRREVRESDREAVRSIVESSGFFSAAEAEVAVELVEERLHKGMASGYDFLFAERSGSGCGGTPVSAPFPVRPTATIYTGLRFETISGGSG